MTKERSHDSHPEDVHGLVPDHQGCAGVGVGGVVGQDVLEPPLVHMDAVAQSIAHVLSRHHRKHVLQLHLQHDTHETL